MPQERNDSAYPSRPSNLRGWYEAGDMYKTIRADERGFLCVSIEAPDAAPVVETLDDSATSITASGGTLHAVSGVPDGAVLLIEEAGADKVSLSPGELLTAPIVLAAGATARLLGIAALFTAPVTFWFLN